MTRLFYGYSGGDVIAQVDSEDGDYAPATTTFDVFTTRTGSTQHTDLLDAGGGAITQVAPNAAGRIMFQGVDAYTGSYWLQDTANPTAARWLVEPVALGDRTAPTGFYTLPGTGIPESDMASAVQTKLDAVAGKYVKPGTGIPESDLDTATQGKIDGAIQKSLVDAKGDLLLGSADNVVIRKAVGTDGQRLIADSTAAGGVSWQDPTTSTATQDALDLKQDIIPTYATLTDAQAAVTAGTLADGALCVIIDPTT